MKTLELLDRLAAFPTVSADSNIELIDFVQAYLSERKFDCFRLLNAAGDKASLFATIGPKRE